MAIGEREVARAAVSATHGFPALPLDLLGALGAKVRPGPEAVVVLLFGDTLHFYPGYPQFAINLRMESLHAAAYREDGKLFVAEWFFTRWLPRYYLGRLSYEGGVLRAPAGAGGPDRPAVADVAGVAPPPGNGDDADPPPSPAPRPVGDPPPSPTRRGYRDDPVGELVGFIDARVAGVYDSNIDHGPDPRSSYGTVARVAVGVQSAPVRPFLMARYDFALYQFADSGDWNRTTHDVSVDVAPALGPLRLRLGGALRLGAWTEDRQPANQIILMPQIEFRPTPIDLVNVYALQSARRIELAAGSQRDTFRLAGAGYYRWWHAGGVRIDGRYEVNKSEYEPSRYRAWTGYLWLRLPLTSRQRVTLQAAYNRRRYPRGFVASPGSEVRRDRRWTVSLALANRFDRARWEVSLGYTFEHNASNSQWAVYQAQRTEFLVRRRW